MRAEGPAQLHEDALHRTPRRLRVCTVGARAMRRLSKASDPI